MNNKNIENKPVDKIKRKTKGKHKKKVLRVLVYIVLILFVLSLLYLLGYGIHYFSTSPKYNVTNVEFKNSKMYSVDTLVDVAKVPIGQNIYKISSKDIKANLESLPYIEEANINKVMPNMIEITLKEYVSNYFAYNKDTDKYIRLTSDGMIIEEVAGELKTEDELLVFGINFDDEIIPKKFIAKSEKEKLLFYEQTEKRYVKSGIEKEITNIEFKEQNIILTLNHDINVILNKEDLDYNINFLKSILDKIEGKAGTIDMTKENPVFTETVR